MFHLSAFGESTDQGGAAADLAAINDVIAFTSGDNLRVPKEVPNLQAAAFLSAATTVTSATVKTPSLRSRNNYRFEPLVNAAVFASPVEIAHLGENPIPLTGGEQMQFESNTDNTGAVELLGLVWLSDGAPVKRGGDIFTIHATSAITLSARTWVNGALTLGQAIPNGIYEVVGLRARGTNLQAARIVFPGTLFRPGVPAVNAVTDREETRFRYGNMGVFGVFDSDNLPSIDALGITDSSQNYLIDVVKIG